MRAFRSLTLISLLLASASLMADAVQPSLIFQSLHQSMWGAGAAAPPSEHRFYMIDPASASWNVAGSGGGFWSQDTYLFGTAEFGAGGSAASSGHVGLWMDLKIDDPGSVDVTYPVTPRIVFPDANSFRAGDTVAINTSYSLDNGWQMKTRSPQFEVGLDASLAFSAHVSARLCVFDCANFDPVPQFAFDTGEFNIVTIRPGDSVSTPPWLGSPIGGTLGVPNISTTGVLASNGRALQGEGSDQFLEVTLNLTDLASSAAKIPFPLSYNTADYPAFDDFTGIHLDYTIIDVEAYARLSARQRFYFQPDLKVSMQFAKPLEHWVVSAGTIGPTTTSSSVEAKVGDTIYVRYPATDKQPTDVGSTFRLDNQFESATGFDLVEGVTTQAAGFHVTIPSIEVFPELCFPAIEVAGIEITPEFCTPSVDTPEGRVGVGPLLDRDDPVAAQDLGNLFSASWQLGGFATVPIDAFALDPENPIVNITQQTGATRNLGAGRRQVAYAIDFANGGDVTLSSVHLVADLAAAFGNAWRYTVDQVIGCDVITNPNFNGAANKDLLAPGNVLEVGAKRRVILIVSVYPKPDPPVYTTTSTADGRSPLDTFVTKSASSDVLLGPAIVQSADDFVLYGDQFVKLDAIGNSTGSIGANDFVEVKNGNSAIVAGDLRAGRTIKVQGEITADYAFSGGIIDVVNKAKLNLSGNAKPYSKMTTYVLSAPAPATPLKGNVWVPDNQSQTLQPGYYGDVTVNAGALLNLVPGTYTFINLTVANNGRVAAMGTSRDAVVNITSPGEVRIGQNAWIRGVLNAPRANMTFEERSHLDGAAAARSITLRPGASAAYHRDCDRLVDPDCDGSPNCAR